MDLDKFVNNSDRWIRLVLFILGPLRNALLEILHNHGVPKDPTNLYNYFSDKPNKKKLNLLNKNNFIKPDQMNLLLPPKSKQTDSKTFDISLILVLLQNFSTIPGSKNDPNKMSFNWKAKNPTASDLPSTCVKARTIRNEILGHYPDPTILSENDFINLWNKFEQILSDLGSTEDVSMLKTQSLDPKQRMVLQSLILYLQTQQEGFKDRLDKFESTQTTTNQDVEQRLQALEKLEIKVSQVDVTSEEFKALYRQVEKQVLESLEQRLIGVENRVGHVEEELKKLKKSVKSINVTSNIALKIVCEDIGSNSEQLAEMLIGEKLEFEEMLTDEEKMKTCFEKLGNLIPWFNGLDDALHSLNRSDIIEKIQEKTCLTNGYERLSSRLKKNYHETLGECEVLKPVNRREQMKRSREDMYVELFTCLNDNNDQEANGNDSEFVMRQQQYPSPSLKIEAKDFFQRRDKLLMIRGVAGVGKTSLLKWITLQWSEGKLFPEVDFLLMFTCQELNYPKYKGKGFEEVLEKRYGSLLGKGGINESLSVLNLLSKVGNRVLIVLDGFDEYTDFEKITNSNSQETAMIREMIDPKASLNGKKVLVSGRPQACSAVIQGGINPDKLLEVIGFSDENTQIYINRYFEDNSIAVNAVKHLLFESDSFKAMARIPVYLSIFCDVYNDIKESREKKFSQDLNTFTKLSIVSCLAFLRSHNRSQTNSTLTEMSENKDIINIIKSLARLAFLCLKDGKRVFYKVECKDIMNWDDLEKSGMIGRKRKDEDSISDVYQFFHNVFLEFLCALHLFINRKTLYATKSIKALSINFRPTLAGLEGILKHPDSVPIYLKNFVINLSKTLNTSSFTLNRMLSNSSASLVDQCAKEFLENQKASAVKRYKDEMFFATFYEFQGQLSTQMKEKFEHAILKFDLLRHHHVLRNVIYFLKTVKVNVESLSILMHDRMLTERELEEVKHLTTVCEHIKIYWTDLPTEGTALKSLSEAIISARKQVTCTKDSCWVFCERDELKDQFLMSGFRTMKMLVLERCDIKEKHLEKLQDCIPYLECIHLGYNRTLSINAMKIFSKQVTKASQLQELWLNDCELNLDSLKELAVFIPLVKHVRLSGNTEVRKPEFLQKLNEQIVDKSVEGCLKLKELWVPNCKIDFDSIVAFKSSLPLLFSFNCNCNKTVDTATVGLITNAIMMNPQQSRLHELNLSYCDLDDTAVEKLGPCINTLEDLLLFGNPDLTSYSMTILSQQIFSCKSSTNMKELWLNDCDLDDDCIDKLMDCLPIVKVLKLRGNKQLTTKSFEMMKARILDATSKGICKLKKLSLDSCGLDKESLKIISTFAPLLDELSLSDNLGITDEAVLPIINELLKASMAMKNELKELNLDCCSISDLTVQRLLTVLHTFQKLTVSTNSRENAENPEDGSSSQLQTTNNCRIVTEKSIEDIIKVLYNIGKKKIKLRESVTVIFDDKLFNDGLRQMIQRYGKFVRHKCVGIFIHIYIL